MLAYSKKILFYVQILQKSMFQIYVSELALIGLDVELGKTFADTADLGPCCPAHMIHLCQLVVLEICYVFSIHSVLKFSSPAASYA